MRDNLKCHCHICKVERSLSASLTQPPEIERFSRLTLTSPAIEIFPSPSALVAHLHDQKNGQSRKPSAGEVLGALIQGGSSVGDCELSQSVLVLAFTPTIHRTYWEVRAWFRELEPADIAQQIFSFFLQLTASAPAEVLNGHIAFVLSQALHRNAVRWARREQLMLLDRDRFLEEQRRPVEPSEDAHFESVSLLKDFLDFCVRKEILSEFERDLLLKVKVDGFVAKEVVDKHTVLSPKAVHVRIQRIMKRLQDAAWELPSLNGKPANSMESVEPMQTKNLSKSMSTFSLSTFSGGAAISVSRRQLSLDSSPKQSDEKRQQLSAAHRNLLTTVATLPKASRRTCVIPGATSRRLAAITSSGSPLPSSRPTESGESLPLNPDAGPARIIRKELAGNEEIPSKQFRLPLAPARVRHILLLADSRISGLRSGGRWLALGKRGQRLDASVHDHHRSRPFARLHCGCRPDVRFW
jgi:hypothetical protein